MSKSEPVRPRCMKNSHHESEGRWGRYGVLCPADEEDAEEASKKRRVAEGLVRGSKLRTGLLSQEQIT